ncbi:hypothetical protein VNO78_15119 [Psophocarpus tetragonolobus]|uniref:Uncharacterized protein n=1 Tax=Psophocarpus tetragonolobus TaxID=3891 RepID=A0AAN9XIX0_PSOTE
MCLCKLGTTIMLSKFLKTEVTFTWDVAKHGPAIMDAEGSSFEKYMARYCPVSRIDFSQSIARSGYMKRLVHAHASSEPPKKVAATLRAGEFNMHMYSLFLDASLFQD